MTMTRRQVETELKLLEQFGFIYQWEQVDGKYEVTLGLPDSNPNVYMGLTLAQAKVFVKTMKYVRYYPTTIKSALDAEQEWLDEVREKLN